MQKHCKPLKKLGRTSAHRRALLRNLATSLIIHERIITTAPKAKALKTWVDKLIDLGRSGKTEDKRKAESLVFRAPETLPKLFGPLAHRYQHYPTPFYPKGTLPVTTNTGFKPMGYTRIFNYGLRNGDRATMAVIEFIANPRDIMARLAMKNLSGISRKIRDLENKKFVSNTVTILDPVTGEEKTVVKRLENFELSSKERDRLNRTIKFYNKLTTALTKSLKRYELASQSAKKYVQEAELKALESAKQKLEKTKMKLNVYKRIHGDGVEQLLSSNEITKLAEKGLVVDTSGTILEEVLSRDTPVVREMRQRFLTDTFTEYLPVNRELLGVRAGTVGNRDVVSEEVLKEEAFAVDEAEEVFGDNEKSGEKEGKDETGLLGGLFKKLKI